MALILTSTGQFAILIVRITILAILGANVTTLQTPPAPSWDARTQLPAITIPRRWWICPGTVMMGIVCSSMRWGCAEEIARVMPIKTVYAMTSMIA